MAALAASVLLQQYSGMADAAEKLSVSMPHKLASAARKRAGRRGLSSFVARAVARALEREALGEFLDELDIDFDAAVIATGDAKDIKRLSAPYPQLSLIQL